MKILTVFGTRPEAIKMVSVIKKFSSFSDVTIKICVTGQHRSMLDQVLSVFNILPEFDLGIMKKNQSLSNITQLTLQGLDKVLDEYPADWVIVQGDTNTTFAGALSAFYKKISVAHIEAGLRTYDKYSPWPEEINRQLTSRIAMLHFAPTLGAKDNLLKEGVPDNKILITGNTGIDALLETVNRIKIDQNLSQQLATLFNFLNPKKKLLLMTSHRRENFGSGILNICKAILQLSQRADLQIVYPIHMNPNISHPVNAVLGNNKNIYLIPPQDYLPFVYLMLQSYIILTDSGGIQEEAPSLGRPVIVTRTITERPEAVEGGTAKLVGTDPSAIVQNITELLDNDKLYGNMAAASHPYGDGFAAQRIVERIIHETRIQKS